MCGGSFGRATVPDNIAINRVKAGAFLVVVQKDEIHQILTVSVGKQIAGMSPFKKATPPQMRVEWVRQYRDDCRERRRKT